MHRTKVIFKPDEVKIELNIRRVHMTPTFAEESRRRRIPLNNTKIKTGKATSQRNANLFANNNINQPSTRKGDGRGRLNHWRHKGTCLSGGLSSPTAKRFSYYLIQPNGTWYCLLARPGIATRLPRYHLALPPALAPSVDAPVGALRELTGTLRYPPLPSRLPLVFAWKRSWFFTNW